MAGSVRGLVLDIDIQDRDKIAGNFLRLPAEIKAGLDGAIGKFGIREIEVLRLTTQAVVTNRTHKRWPKGAKSPNTAAPFRWLENSYRFDTQRFAAAGREMSLSFYSTSPYFKFVDAGRGPIRNQLTGTDTPAYHGAWATGWLRFTMPFTMRSGAQFGNTVFAESVGPAAPRHIIDKSVPGTTENLSFLEREIGDALGAAWAGTGVIKAPLLGPDTRGGELGFPRRVVSNF